MICNIPPLKSFIVILSICSSTLYAAGKYSLSSALGNSEGAAQFNYGTSLVSRGSPYVPMHIVDQMKAANERMRKEGEEHLRHAQETLEKQESKFDTDMRALQDRLQRKWNAPRLGAGIPADVSPKPLYGAIGDKNWALVIKLLEDGADPYEQPGIVRGFSSSLVLLVSPAHSYGIPRFSYDNLFGRADEMETNQSSDIYFPINKYPEEFHRITALILAKRDRCPPSQVEHLYKLVRENAWVKRRDALRGRAAWLKLVDSEARAAEADVEYNKLPNTPIISGLQSSVFDLD